MSADLAPVVPAVASWKLASLPRRLPAATVAAVVNGCDRGTEAGCREYAIVLMLARLGLRVTEVAALTLDDIDWRAGELTIHGKGGRSDNLPLMWDVGEALADYLRARRPQCAARTVFVTAYAPRRALTASAVRAVVYHACARAGVERAGPHRLRHSLASDLLAAGSSLHEIGQVLRHQNAVTTAIYAKTDRKALAVLARQWPLECREGAV
jgi:site-specific recombinase XerD